jgi:signal transduction histidine kinase
MAISDAPRARVSATDSAGRPRARRTVAGRLLVSVLVLLTAVAATMGWSLSALREAAHDATLVRDAYVPLLSTIGEALAGQNVMNTQLNHITTAKNPADVQQWIETARRVRPLTLARLREEAQRGLVVDLDRTGLRDFLLGEIERLEGELAGEGARFQQLFAALAQGESGRAEAIRDKLIATETAGAERLRSMRQRVSEDMAALTEAAQARERLSMRLLVGLSVLTLIVGLLTSLHARRVLAPLSAVTGRARAVAEGDLRPRDIVATDDEIGELAHTFEDMVAAIRKARAELVQAERLATIGKMAAHITHEVRNPLSSIGLNLELLEEELAALSPGKESAQLLAAIKREVERLSQISEQYLAAVRQPRLQLSREDVGDIVRECHAFVRPELERAGIVSELRVAPDLPEIDVDEAQLRQALFNLMRNAREVLTRDGEVLLTVAREGDQLLVAVQDDGPGVPEELRASIFDPFYTTKRHGTGLGLAVTRSIIEAHGGSIACEARDAGGTRFTIALPIAS